ncbi:hypothetical protein PIB30_021985 [Stylosanthes scabra]|uniref:Uncharacterized protein n=1 Tax=Stylosanthes scabra TaxID=79078 RepID=A0ABU6WAW7_9FABA|nr:hypothetical protein [Stylosanthes scabra]
MSVRIWCLDAQWCERPHMSALSLESRLNYISCIVSCLESNSFKMKSDGKPQVSLLEMNDEGDVRESRLATTTYEMSSLAIGTGIHYMHLCDTVWFALPDTGSSSGKQMKYMYVLRCPEVSPKVFELYELMPKVERKSPREAKKNKESKESGQKAKKSPIQR